MKPTKNEYLKVASAIALWVQEDALYINEACQKAKASFDLFLKIWHEAAAILETDHTERPSSVAIQIALEKAGYC
jgi:hypothetical protein